MQAEVKQYTTLVVVTRFKRDFLQMSKRGGKETSNVDSRVTFLAQRGAFKRTENFVVQVSSETPRPGSTSLELAQLET